MQYRNKFSNKHFDIRINSNNKRIYTLIRNLLDLGIAKSSHRERTPITFYLKVVREKYYAKERNRIYNYSVNKDGHLLNYLGRTDVEVISDHKKRIVRSNIYNFDKVSNFLTAKANL